MNPKDQESRKFKILESAHKLFSHYGFEKTTIEDIAKEAELGKGTIYLEFDSKEAILMAIINNFIEEELAKIKDYIAELNEERQINSKAKNNSEKELKKQNIIKQTKKMFLNHILRTYDIATNHLHSSEALVHTSNRVRSEFETFFTRKHNMLAELLELAAENKEIKKSYDFSYHASLIMKGLCGLMPPYNPHVNAKGKLSVITRKELENYTKDLLDILFTCT
jgi:AcrR family transcriptional regulator